MGQVVYSPNYKAFVTLVSGDVDKQSLPVQSEEYADLTGIATVCLSVRLSCITLISYVYQITTMLVLLLMPLVSVAILFFLHSATQVN